MVYNRLSEPSEKKQNLGAPIPKVYNDSPGDTKPIARVGGVDSNFHYVET